MHLQNLKKGVVCGIEEIFRFDDFAHFQHLGGKNLFFYNEGEYFHDHEKFLIDYEDESIDTIIQKDVKIKYMYSVVET